MKKALFISLLLIGFGTQAQVMQLDKASELSVSGTSTLHDWTIVAEEISGSAKFEISDAQLMGVSDLTIKVKVEEIKSGKSGMDNNTYKALNSDQHPFISFNLSNGSASQSGSKYLFSGQGNLTIAGTKKPINLKATCDLAGNSVVCEGSYAMKMTDFNVDPPTAMFGTIKTGNEITIDFKINFTNSEMSKL